MLLVLGPGRVTDAVTSAIGDYGLYAVFALMLVDAVFPAASEPVMVYSGAVASGAFVGQDVVLAGHKIEEGFLRPRDGECGHDRLHDRLAARLVRSACAAAARSWSATAVGCT